MLILTRIVGISGLILSAVSFQCKDRKKLLTISTVSELLFAIQYLTLGAWTGAAINALGSLRKIIFLKSEKNNKISVIIFCILFIIASAITWKGPVSILAVIAKCVTTISYAARKTSVMRAVTFSTNAAWCIYDCSERAYESAISDLIAIISIIVGIIRLDTPQHRKDTVNANS